MPCMTQLIYHSKRSDQAKERTYDGIPCRLKGLVELTFEQHEAQCV